MPTSAIGERGFTLIELLAVLTILSIATAAVLLVVPTGRGSVHKDAEKLAARIALVRDKAIIGSRPTALAIDPAGYQFEERRRGEWLPMDEKRLGRTSWGDGINVQSTARIAFDPTGAADGDFRLTLQQDTARAVIQIDATGQVRVLD
jgi:general secretion pathway protein H